MIIELGDQLVFGEWAQSKYRHSSIKTHNRHNYTKKVGKILIVMSKEKVIPFEYESFHTL